MNKLGVRSARRILRSKRVTEDIVLRRTSGSRNAHDEWVADDPVDTPLKASVENTSLANSSRREPTQAGNRVVDERTFFIFTQDHDLARSLRTGQNATYADVIIHNGLEFIVNRMMDFTSHGHIEVFTTRREGQDDQS